MSAGILELVKRRPVDYLQAFLEERAASQVDQFFSAYGSAEASAACLLLCTAPPSPVSQVRMLSRVKPAPPAGPHRDLDSAAVQLRML